MQSHTEPVGYIVKAGMDKHIPIQLCLLCPMNVIEQVDIIISKNQALQI